MMKKLAGGMALALILSGCTVNAKDDLCSYSATVMSSDDESAVVRIESEISEETGCTRSKEHYHAGETVRLENSRGLLIFDEDRIMSMEELEDNEKVVVTFSDDKTVMHTIDDED